MYLTLPRNNIDDTEHQLQLTKKYEIKTNMMAVKGLN
jgi:hypothetical protein